jgi:hypothetical protein
MTRMPGSREYAIACCVHCGVAWPTTHFVAYGQQMPYSCSGGVRYHAVAPAYIVDILPGHPTLTRGVNERYHVLAKLFHAAKETTS